MDYLGRADHREARLDPRRLLEGARAAIVVTAAHDPSPAPPADGDLRASVARYARAADYHWVIKQRLHQLGSDLAAALPTATQVRACVDSAPLLERDLAERAGIGFIGKNTMLIQPGAGSYLLLGELLVDVDIAPTPPARPRNCGNCTACLQACPTAALTAPYQLDARNCIAYLTIEHRGVIPRPLRPAIGLAIFGCDLCQEVCPFNAAAGRRLEPLPELITTDPQRIVPNLLDLLDLGSNQLSRYRKGTALRRVNREQLLRNICIALGNSGDMRALPALAALLADRNPLVRGHAAWALARIGDNDTCRGRLAAESDEYVRAEINSALAGPADEA